MNFFIPNRSTSGNKSCRESVRGEITEDSFKLVESTFLLRGLLKQLGPSEIGLGHKEVIIFFCYGFTWRKYFFLLLL